MSASPSGEPARPARPRIVRRVGLVALALGLVAVIGFVIWAENPLRAEPGPLAAVRADPQLDVRETGDTVQLVPRDPNGTGLLFVSGARVDAAAYAATLRGVADSGVTVVIVKPILNFSIFEFRSPRSFEAGVTGVDRWFVGGHSLGGVTACRWAADGGTAGLVLFGSYCADDLSRTDVPVLSVSGGRDGLSTPAKVGAARHLLPADAETVRIAGAAHAQFGAYGAQPGDGTPTASDAEVTRAITRAVVPFLAR